MDPYVINKIKTHSQYNIHDYVLNILIHNINVTPTITISISPWSFHHVLVSVEVTTMVQKARLAQAEWQKSSFAQRRFLLRTLQWLALNGTLMLGIEWDFMKCNGISWDSYRPDKGIEDDLTNSHRISHDLS